VSISLSLGVIERAVLADLESRVLDSESQTMLRRTVRDARRALFAGHADPTLRRAGLCWHRASVALATVIPSGGMETCSLRVAHHTTTNEKTTRLFFSSSRVVSVRMG
jgi:hypothetical protein